MAKKAVKKTAKKKVKTKRIVKKTIKKKSPVEPTIHCTFVGDAVMTENTDAARDLFHKSCFGTLLDTKKVQLSLLEALYLFQKGSITILNKRGNPMTEDAFVKQAEKQEPNFFLRYAVFKDFRSRGYIIKTALKFGADFRVYERGVKPGEDHAKWVVFPVHEASTLTWHEFSSKNRVAHSTKKRLLLGVVDDEGCPTYYEIRWVRP